MKSEELKASYAKIEDQVGKGARELVQIMIGAFANGLGAEPKDKVDSYAAQFRTLAILVEAAKDHEFDYNQGWPGFVYYLHDSESERKVLGDFRDDPLMPRLLEVLWIYHAEVAEKRNLSWNDDATERYEHEKVLVTAFRGMMAQVYYRAFGRDSGIPEVT